LTWGRFPDKWEGEEDLSMHMKYRVRRPSSYHAEIALAAAVLGGVLACAAKPDHRPSGDMKPPSSVVKPPALPPPKQEVKVVASPAAVAAKLGVELAELKWSPARTSYAAAIAPKPSAGNGARYRLVVFGASGKQRAEVDAARPGLVEDLHFLRESRLVYRIAPPARPPGKRACGPKPTGKKKTRPAPTTLYVIQPFAPIAAPIPCEGRRFTFSRKGEHVAWVTGEPGREWLGADGKQVYPRAGVTRIQGEPAWSADGRSLALIEGGADPRLVVLVEFDNPHGDNVWPLPADATDPTLRVFWAGAGRVVVGHDITQPVFSTSFRRE
jgi:hypothetical protein